ncbi:D-isomer specific 2-hydroxyacid dehydrogenase family protein [Subtercola lobariae]|uniref:D-isomer specific 2-hydroxyacid dehydrogenase family protein n=1 Tax=Subtercola lobariae TaxID=1588641 RepID=UPI001E353E86|nr:D-isomer specific 2-hydroxyacid dehydrogenase family protein [Subtercola lobariae]
MSTSDYDRPVSAAASQPAQHEAVLASPATPLAEAVRPTPGPIAVLPVAGALFVDAIEAAGGQVAPLSDATRGLVWLDSGSADELGRVLESHPGIQWLQLPWAGVDSFSELLATHSRPGLLVTSAKGAYAQPVAEHALTLTLAVMRHLAERARATSWATTSTGESLYGRHVVIVGAGGIAVELLRLLAPFGVQTTVVRRQATPLAGATRTVTTDALRAVLPTADVIVLAAALTSGTENLFGAAEFALLKPTAYLVNIARGGLVDTDALVTALNSGALAGAGLDVTDPEPLPAGHPLWRAQNVIITSHSADTPEMTAPLLAKRLHDNVAALLGDGAFVGIVDPKAGY